MRAQRAHNNENVLFAESAGNCICSRERKSSRRKRQRKREREGGRESHGGKLKKTRRDTLRALTRDRIRATSFSCCFHACSLIESLCSDSFDFTFWLPRTLPQRLSFCRCVYRALILYPPLPLVTAKLDDAVNANTFRTDGPSYIC